MKSTWVLFVTLHIYLLVIKIRLLLRGLGSEKTKSHNLIFFANYDVLVKVRCPDFFQKFFTISKIEF